MLHKHLLDFTRKYNKEFAIKGYSKLKKAELQQKIESVLNKQRTEIKEEYKKLKMMKAETKPKPAPVKKPAPKKETKPKPAPKKETKPAPVKTNKNEELIKYINENIKLLTPSEKKIYEEAIKDINTFSKELKIFENKIKKGTKERFENRTKVANKRISIAEKNLIKLKNSIKASNKREEPKKETKPKPAPKKEEPKKETKKAEPAKEDINYKKVLKLFDEYYKLVNVELKKYLEGKISSDELEDKQYNELQDEYNYKGLAISLGLYKDIRGSRYIDPKIEKELNKESKNYKEFLKLIKQSPKKEEPKKETKPKPEPKKEQPKRNEKVDDLIFKIENNPNYNDNYNTLVKFLQKTKEKNIFPIELTFAFTQKQNEEHFKALDNNPKLFMDFMAELAKGIKDNNDLKFNILKKYDKKPSNMSVKSQGIIGDEFGMKFKLAKTKINYKFKNKIT